MKSSIPNAGGTFQPLRHRSGTMRDRLHGYTKRTLGAGGSVTEAVSSIHIHVHSHIEFISYTLPLSSKTFGFALKRFIFNLKFQLTLSFFLEKNAE